MAVMTWPSSGLRKGAALMITFMFEEMAQGATSPLKVSICNDIGHLLTHTSQSGDRAQKQTGMKYGVCGFFTIFDAVYFLNISEVT